MFAAWLGRLSSVAHGVCGDEGPLFRPVKSLRSLVRSRSRHAEERAPGCPGPRELRPQLSRHLRGFPSVRRFSAHGPVRSPCQQRTYSAPYRFVIVNNEDAQRRSPICILIVRWGYNPCLRGAYSTTGT